jgi:hypothetical protein
MDSPRQTTKVLGAHRSSSNENPSETKAYSSGEVVKALISSANRPGNGARLISIEELFPSGSLRSGPKETDLRNMASALSHIPVDDTRSDTAFSGHANEGPPEVRRSFDRPKSQSDHLSDTTMEYLLGMRKTQSRNKS